MERVKIIDLTMPMDLTTALTSGLHQSLALSLAESLHSSGCALIKHPLVDESINER